MRYWTRFDFHLVISAFVDGFVHDFFYDVFVRFNGNKSFPFHLRTLDCYVYIILRILLRDVKFYLLTHITFY